MLIWRVTIRYFDFATPLCRHAAAPPLRRYAFERCHMPRRYADVFNTDMPPPPRYPCYAVAICLLLRCCFSCRCYDTPLSLPLRLPHVIRHACRLIDIFAAAYHAAIRYAICCHMIFFAIYARLLISPAMVFCAKRAIIRRHATL